MEGNNFGTEEVRLIVSQSELRNVVNEAVSSAFRSHQEYPDKSDSVKPLTISEACSFSKCAESTIRKAFREKRLKGHRQAGRLYFFEEDLVRWIKS